MKYCEETRAMLHAYQRETEARIYALQQKVYQLQTRVFEFELERYFENYKPHEKK